MPVIEQHVIWVSVIAHAVAVDDIAILTDAGHQEVQYAYHVDGLELVDVSVLVTTADIVADGEARVVHHSVCEVILLGILHLDDERLLVFRGAVDIEHSLALFLPVRHLLLLAQGDLADALLGQNCRQKLQQKVLVAVCPVDILESPLSQVYCYHKYACAVCIKH